MAGASGSFRSGLDRVRSIELASKALEESGLELVAREPEKGVIVARKGPSLASWGETVTVTVEGGGHETTLKIESRSDAQIVDWGSNASNVELVLAALKRLRNG